MKTTYDQYSQYEYLTDEKESKEASLIKSAQESIISTIESYEAECDEDVDQEELARLKAIDLNSIEINDVEDICSDDYSVCEELENLNSIYNEIMKLGGNIDEVNSILAILPESTMIQCSRKSESTYIAYPIEMMKEFTSEFENIINFNYYEDLANEDLNELDTFKVRIACHEVGSRFNEYSNDSVSYSDECIFIKA